MKIALFLGAGASVPYKKPTTSQLRSILLKQKEPNNLKQNLIQSIFNIEGFKDIEYILRACDEFSKFYTTYGSEIIKEFERKRLGHQIVAYESSGYSYSQVGDKLQEIVKRIEDAVFDNYSWNHDDDSDQIIQKIFDPLISFLEESSESINVFTTNYDRAVEEYCKIKNHVCVDGFKPSQFDGRAFWTDGDFTYFDNINKTRIYLHKLHGSLGWKYHKKDGLERTNYERKSQYPNYTKDLLIYPVLDPKHSDEQPFETLRRKFDEYMMNDADFCIVIGYSFRDSHVNDIFKKFSSRGKTLISIAPHCITDFRKNILGETPDKETIEDHWERTEEYTLTKRVPDGSQMMTVHLIQWKLEENTIQGIVKLLKKHLK